MAERWRWCACVVTCLQFVDFLCVFARMTKADILIVVFGGEHCRHWMHVGFVCAFELMCLSCLFNGVGVCGRAHCGVGDGNRPSVCYGEAI